MNKKLNNYINHLICGGLLLFLVISIPGPFKLWALTWHIFNSEQISLHDGLNVQIPLQWWVVSRKNGNLVLAMVPERGKDKPLFVFVEFYKDLKNLTFEEAKKYSLPDCGAVEIKFFKTTQFANVEAFQTRYINKNTNAISEIWVIPTIGCVIKVRDVAQYLFPQVSNFLLSNFSIIQEQVPGTRT